MFYGYPIVKTVGKTLTVQINWMKMFLYIFRMNELLRLWVSIQSNTIFSHFVCVFIRGPEWMWIRIYCRFQMEADEKERNVEKKGNEKSNIESCNWWRNRNKPPIANMYDDEMNEKGLCVNYYANVCESFLCRLDECTT